VKKFPFKLLILILLIVFFANGCAILQIPGQIIGGVFQLVGKALDIVARMPKPPPGVFF
jgi:hypothetical protein